MPRRPLISPRRPRLGPNLACALAILGAGWLSRLLLHCEVGDYPLLCLADAIALGLLLRNSRAYLPGVLVGLLASALPAAPEYMLSAWLRSCVECLWVLIVLPRTRWHSDFRRPRDVMIFVALVVLAAPITGALAGRLVLGLLGEGWALGLSDCMRVWARAAGLGLCVPAITLFNRREWAEMNQTTRLQVFAVLVLTPAALLFELFRALHPSAAGYPLAIVPFPLVIWLAIGTSLSVAMCSLAVLGLLLYAATTAGLGFFATPDIVRTALSVDGFMTTLVVSTLLIGSLQRNRLRAEILTRHALSGAKTTLWEWLPERGLLIHDTVWAANFRSQPGHGVDPTRLAKHIESLQPVSLFCGPLEEPNLDENEEELFRLQLPDGTWRWIRCRRLPEPPASAALHGTQNGILMDVTEQIEAEALREQSLAREAELKSLKHSIHPHFLFNALNTLRSLITLRPLDAREFVTRLAAFLRGSLGPVQEHSVRFGEEVALVKHYLGIEQFRFGDRLRFSIEATPACWQVPFPPMVLQTLVENAVKYGVARRPEGGGIDIVAQLDNGFMVVRIVNDGPLVPTPPHATGTGLQNSQARLRILFGETASIMLTEQSGPKVVAEVRIPFTR